MFTTTHDVMLLVLAGLYVLVTLVRSMQFAQYTSAQQRRVGGSWLTVPALISAALVIVAVLW